MTDLTNTSSSNLSTTRAWRKEMGPMPANVRDALVRASSEDLGTAWGRVDRAIAKAIGIPQYACDARDYLRCEGLSADEARLVVACIWPQAK